MSLFHSECHEILRLGVAPLANMCDPLRGQDIGNIIEVIFLNRVREFTQHLNKIT